MPIAFLDGEIVCPDADGRGRNGCLPLSVHQLTGCRLPLCGGERLDDTVPETHDWAGRLRFWYEWDWHEAEREFSRAIELNPNYPDVRMMYSRTDELPTDLSVIGDTGNETDHC